MSTHNTHREKSDGDLSVVEQQPVSKTETSSNATPTTETASSVGNENDVVRPFTDFIEEFRQAEDANALTAQTVPVAPQERPVSPLLRPARHIRLPRHQGGRQRDAASSSLDRKVQQAPNQVGESTQAGQTVPFVQDTQSLAAEVQSPKEESATPPTDLQQEPQVEPAPVEEQPKPARRYRFDRPTYTPTTPAVSVSAQPALPATSVQIRTEENKEALSAISSASIRTDEAQPGEHEVHPSQHPKQVTNVTQEADLHVAKQSAVPESSTSTAGATATVPAPTTSARDRRRRHGQDRQREKEKAAPVASSPSTPVVEVINPITEPVTPLLPEVALEDLPPLEYSELQAASSRRRRRRRSGTSATGNQSGVKSIVADLPSAGVPFAGNVTSMPSPTSPVAVSRNVAVTPGIVASPGQYTIVSGYTVNQMNQPGDGAGPFMGPEPSPARGSSHVRGDVRTIRAETQRVPSYPMRPGEPSSASINHLAQVIAQSISAQTDRMVAELRRANQSPTNVSVSLPPFPSTERVGVFVDVANLLYSARTLRMTIDFGKLLDFLRGNRRLVRAQAYCPTSPQPGDEQMFLQAVKGLGYRITTKNYKTFSSGAKKADMDLDLCMDVVRLVDGKAVDCIVLVSGDSDFIPLLDYCFDHGVRVEVAAFDESMSATLRQGCDLFINLSLLDEIRA